MKRRENERLRRLEVIVAREQENYDKNEPSVWGYYNAYSFVLNEIDKLLNNEGEENE
tara:strand:- start:566 stop:736 length:171 start_codon:yes stop_codon:yes gene_type:complete